MGDKVKYHLVVVVPCFNEASRIDLDVFEDYLTKNPLSLICFVDDKSTDNTYNILSTFSEKNSNCLLLKNEQNIGKGNSIYFGITHALNCLSFEHIGYLDADLATPLDELERLNSILINSPETSLVFGSRILTINNSIKRKKYRHFIGRVIATFISTILKSKIYDTQCGAKVMTRDCAKVVMNNPFISRWLFDVEILKRIQLNIGKLKNTTIEEPLKTWEDKGKSSVKWTYGFKVWYDLIIIKLKY